MSQASPSLGIRVSTTKTGMAAQLLAWLSECFCKHEFSWPHTGAQGRDYQVCVLCGVAYEYDMTSMCRTRRLDAPPEPVPMDTEWRELS